VRAVDTDFAAPAKISGDDLSTEERTASRGSRRIRYGHGTRNSPRVNPLRSRFSHQRHKEPRRPRIVVQVRGCLSSSPLKQPLAASKQPRPVLTARRPGLFVISRRRRNILHEADRLSALKHGRQHFIAAQVWHIVSFQPELNPQKSRSTNDTFLPT
jgi:hypothetical protein